MLYDRFGQPLYTVQEASDVNKQFDEFEHVKQVANELYNEWETYSYGIPKKGKIENVPSAEYYEKHYHFLSPEEFEKYGGGICWDYVEWGVNFLKDKDVKVRTFYIWTETPPNWDTHTFLVIDCGDMQRYVYVESSFKLLKGVWIHNSLDEIIDTITWNMFKCNDNARRFDKFRYVVFEYTGSHPPYGCTCRQYMDWMVNQKDIREGYAEKDKPPAGIVKESADIFLEEKLSAEDKKKLPDDMYGLIIRDKDGNIIDRKYPLNDEDHVLQAVRFFNKAPDEYKEELARNIVKRAKELNMDWEKWDVLKPHLNKSKNVQESVTHDGVSNAKQIAKRINAQYKKDSKPPTGNQNCLICTWCAEANFRGINALPRPVYSPRDPIFDINGWDIVIKPNKTPIKSKDDVIKKLTVSGNGARYYIHVHWRGGSGGHEFLLLNIDNTIYVMDAQQGFVEPITSKEGSKYFDDADYKDSFICRLDNKDFNQTLFDENNDRSKTLRWNPKLDIPYMREHDMLGEDEEFNQDIMTESYAMEGAWQDIRNGVNPWSKTRYFHITTKRDLDKKPLQPRIPTWVKELKDPEKTMKETGRWENITTPRVCVSTSIEGALNSIMNIWKLTDKKFGSEQLYVFTPEKPIDQYKHKTNKEIIRDGDVFDAQTTKEAWILEPVKMKFYGTIQVDRVSDNGNSYPVIMPGGKKNKDDKIGKYTYKWHWLIHPSVQKKMDQYDAENAAEEAAKKKKDESSKPIKEGYTIMDSYRSIQSFLEGNYTAFQEADEDVKEKEKPTEDMTDEELEDDMQQTEKEDTTDVPDTEVSNNVGDDSDMDLSDFGDNGGDDLPNNEYDPKEVETLNALVASEASAMSEYMDAAKASHVDVLQRLYSDIGDEERFHMEQLLFAKAELTGEKYIPRDPDVKKEYEELLEMGMDEESAMATAVDKMGLRAKIDESDGDIDVDIETIEHDVEALECAICNTELLLTFMEHAEEVQDQSVIDQIITITESYYVQEEVMNTRTMTKQQNPPANLGLALVKAIWSIINLFAKLINTLKAWLKKSAYKRDRLRQWIDKHGIVGLFSSPISMYIWNDHTNDVDFDDIVYDINLLTYLTRYCGETAKLDDKYMDWFNQFPRNWLPFGMAPNHKNGFPNTPEDAWDKIRGIESIKTRIVVNENNENLLREIFFGKTDKTSFVKFNPNSGSDDTIYKSNNIYNRMEYILDACKFYANEAGKVMDGYHKIEGDQNSIFYTDHNLYSQNYKYLKGITKNFSTIAHWLSHDMKVVMYLNDGVLQEMERYDTEHNNVSDRQQHPNQWGMFADDSHKLDNRNKPIIAPRG